MKLNELRGQIVSVYGRQYIFARAVNASDSRVSRILSGTHQLERSEARIWEKKLELKDGELGNLEKVNEIKTSNSISS